MTLYHIDNAQSFFERLLKCQGKVVSVDSEGRATDMKQMAEYFIRSGLAANMPRIDEIHVQLERDDDVMSLMSYAAQMAREENRRSSAA